MAKDSMPDDLRPITKVMFASALIPGGKFLSPFLDPLSLCKAQLMDSLSIGVSGTRTGSLEDLLSYVH
ncbi:hypothetical protein ASPZODRAFT_131162 [Penicilliopsis zonata CBS 506.65]|uniref:Uncharacterized protein n=1 Tax=Penicilliopsis zonata CBS 506.65 TaxID=1073090 RepID=A0A1L9SK83_9EURO|nr:hypothetical protein ASPZODRAFT_131162 [Penicilliopsis zonata CBS 506.65]OJJ47620.1 hypothetical protein ASPZODRAFT_131162 [Penicilliopsis zonata CBS 506.65]